MSSGCTWTRQQTVSPALSPFMTINAYMAVPPRSITNTCFSLWRQPNNMASSSTAQSVGSGNPKFPSMVQFSLLKACGQIPPNPSPPRPYHTWLLCKTSVLPRPDKLPPTLQGLSDKTMFLQEQLAEWGLESLDRCSLPVRQGADLPDPPQYNPCILWMF